jgi:hypothetical protein
MANITCHANTHTEQAKAQGLHVYRLTLLSQIGGQPMKVGPKSSEIHVKLSTRQFTGKANYV